MKSRFLFMKFLGLLLVIIGFSYCLTSFSNFFEYVFKTRIFAENLNIYLMSIGLFIPLYTFIFGIYFYFYSDFNITKVSKFLLISFISLLIVSLLMFKFNNLQIFEFIHISCSYTLFILSILGIYGCYKFKF